MKIKIKHNTIVIALLIASFFGISTVFAAENIKYQLSTHILDINKGMPAENVEISLYKLNSGSNEWVLVSTLSTNKDGRITDFLPQNQDNKGTYKLQFKTSAYFKKQGINSIYPYIEVSFMIDGNSHYHIPITVSANGYSTYRGS